MAIKFKTIPCRACNGKGRLPERKDVGVKMRKLREKAGLEIQDVARRLGVDNSLISHRENGRKAWSLDFIGRYLAALKP